MSQFYKPIPLTIQNIPILVYPMKGIEELVNRGDNSSIQLHLEKLYRANEGVVIGKLHIAILWVDDSHIMTDIWQYTQIETENTGFTIDCKTFQDIEPITGNGLTASDGLIMLGRETEFQEKVRKQSRSIDKFVFGERPILPDEINPTEYFYKDNT